MVRNLSETEITTRYRRYRAWQISGYEELSSNSRVMLGRRRWQGDLVRMNHTNPSPYRAHDYSCSPSVAKCQSNWYSGYKDGRNQWYRFVYEGTLNLPNAGMGQVDGQPWDYRFPDWVRLQARTDLINSLTGDATNLGTFVGELPEAISMVSDAVTTLAKAYRAARRLDSKGVAKALRKGLDKQIADVSSRRSGPLSNATNPRGIGYREFTAAAKEARIARNKAIRNQLGYAAVSSGPKAAADVWLAYSFGWKPFLSDIYSLVEQTLGPDKKGKTFSVQRTRSTFDRMSDKFGTGGVYNFSGGGDKGCQIGVVYRLDDPFLHQLASSGLINPASIVWELLPMSFLIDYLIPIGQALSAASAHMGLSFIHGYETKFSYGDLTVTRPGFSVPYGYTEIVPASWKVSTFGMDRVPIYDWPVPSLTIRSGITATQGINTMALLLKNGAS